MATATFELGNVQIDKLTEPSGGQASSFGDTITAPGIDAPAASVFGIGTTNATAINIGHMGLSTYVYGSSLFVGGDIDSITAGALNIGSVNATSGQIGSTTTAKITWDGYTAALRSPNGNSTINADDTNGVYIGVPGIVFAFGSSFSYTTVDFATSFAKDNLIDVGLASQRFRTGRFATSIETPTVLASLSDLDLMSGSAIARVNASGSNATLLLSGTCGVDTITGGAQIGLGAGNAGNMRLGNSGMGTWWANVGGNPGDVSFMFAHTNAMSNGDTAFQIKANNVSKFKLYKTSGVEYAEFGENIVPSNNNAYSLGTSSVTWSDGYFGGKIVLDGYAMDLSAGALSGQALVYNGTAFVAQTVGSGNLSGSLTSASIPYATGGTTLADSGMTWDAYGMTISSGQFITTTTSATIPPAITWTAPILINSWQNTNVGLYNAVGYYKDAMGFVHLRGHVYNGSTGTAAFTLPAGYRAAVGALQFLRSTGPSASTCIVSIQGSGNVVISDGSGDVGADGASLEGICFYAEA